MMITDFLLCRRCGVLHPVAPTGDPRFADPEAAVELQAFRAAHAAHEIEDAERLPEDALLDRPTWDPMATRWFHVDTGPDVLLVRSWRPNLAEARRYEVALGAPPQFDDARVDVDEPLLRRALDRHFYPQALRPSVLDGFVRAVHELVERLDPDDVEIAFDDVMLPNSSIGPFPGDLCEPLLARCRQLFDAVELDRVRSFIADHRLEDGALAIRVRRSTLTRAA